MIVIASLFFLWPLSRGTIQLWRSPGVFTVSWLFRCACLYSISFVVCFVFVSNLDLVDELFLQGHVESWEGQRRIAFFVNSMYMRQPEVLYLSNDLSLCYFVVADNTGGLDSCSWRTNTGNCVGRGQRGVDEAPNC